MRRITALSRARPRSRRPPRGPRASCSASPESGTNRAKSHRSRHERRRRRSAGSTPRSARSSSVGVVRQPRRGAVEAVRHVVQQRARDLLVERARVEARDVAPRGPDLLARPRPRAPRAREPAVLLHPEPAPSHDDEQRRRDHREEQRRQEQRAPVDAAVRLPERPAQGLDERDVPELRPHLAVARDLRLRAVSPSHDERPEDRRPRAGSFPARDRRTRSGAGGASCRPARAERAPTPTSSSRRASRPRSISSR